jgi:hypothetical protein
MMRVEISEMARYKNVAESHETYPGAKLDLTPTRFNKDLVPFIDVVLPGIFFRDLDIRLRICLLEPRRSACLGTGVEMKWSATCG